MTSLARWQQYEKLGWSWAIGWNANYGGYYAQAWRNLPKPAMVDGRLYYRECVTEGGRTVSEAECKAWQRLDGIDALS